MTLAIFVLVSLALSNPYKARDEGDPRSEARVESLRPAGLASILLRLDHELPGMIVSKISDQTITDLASGSADPAAEQSRLEALQFEAAAIEVAFMTPEARGELGGSDVVIQVASFRSHEGAKEQWRHDRDGALARDFGAVKSEHVADLSTYDGGFEFIALGPETSRGQVIIRGVGIVQSRWTIAVVSSTPPGAEPVTTALLKELVGRQVEKLEGRA